MDQSKIIWSKLIYHLFAPKEYIDILAFLQRWELIICWLT